MMSLMLFSCNKEKVYIHGSTIGKDNQLVQLVLKSANGKERLVKSDVELDDNQFETDLEGLKPPFKLTVRLKNDNEIDFWIFRYGSFDVALDSEKDEVKFNKSFENCEYNRIQANYKKMYFLSLEDKIDWIKAHEGRKDLNTDEEFQLYEYQDELKKAIKLRKKSVLSTFRKSPQNRIAMALLFDEYERLTSWQKKECSKSVQKYFSDCGINWQLRN